MAKEVGSRNVSNPWEVKPCSQGSGSQGSSIQMLFEAPPVFQGNWPRSKIV